MVVFGNAMIHCWSCLIFTVQIKYLKYFVSEHLLICCATHGNKANVEDC